MKAAAFLDTSAWFAALNDREVAHERTHAAYQELIHGAHPCVTSNLVIGEMHAMLLRRRGRAQALGFLDTLYAERMHDVRFVDRQLESAAIDRWIRPFRDQRFSLTDAVSFEIMRQENIKTAFALDRHFAAAGFELLPA